MPTSRTGWFLFAAFVFYVFANQTQLGWLYVISALLCGILPAAGLAGMGVLRGISGERILSKTDVDAPVRATHVSPLQSESHTFHEADDITIALSLQNTRRIP